MKNTDFYPALIQAVHWRLTQLENNNFNTQTLPKANLSLNVNGVNEEIPVYSFSVPKNASFPYVLLLGGASSDFSSRDFDGLSGSLEINFLDKSTSSLKAITFLERAYSVFQNFNIDFSVNFPERIEWRDLKILDFKLESKNVNIFNKDNVIGELIFSFIIG